MVPDKFNMVDMEGIDLVLMQGEEVPGLYEKLVESITQCRYQCLYNWSFDGVLIPPTYVQLSINDNDEVQINEGVIVTDEDVIHIYSLEPPAPDPEIIPLSAEENGVYNTPAGVDGFSPVTVNVPIYTPVITAKTIIENGVYNAPTGVDGYSPVTVNVPSVASPLFLVNSGELDAYNDTNYKEGGLPFAGVMARYSSAPFFSVGSGSFDGATKSCLYRSSTDICGIIFTRKILSGEYTKLRIKCFVVGTSSTAQRAWLGLLPSCNFSNADGWFFESGGNRIIRLTDTDWTAADINAQQGVVINVSDNKNLAEQIVEITLPQSDVFVALLNWNCNIYVREIYAE